MTIAYANIGVAASGTSTISLGLPAITVGQMLVAFVGYGNSTAAATTGPAGWTYLGTSYGGAGSWGVGTGPRGCAVYYRQADGTETGTPTFTNGGTGTDRTMRGTIVAYSRSLGSWAVPVLVAGNDAAVDTAFSATAGSDPGGLAGDCILAAAALSPSGASTSGHALTWTGTGATTVTQRAAGAGPGGNSVRMNSWDRGVTGTSSAAPIMAATLGLAGTGSCVFVRLREVSLSGPGFQGVTGAGAMVNMAWTPL